MARQRCRRRDNSIANNVLDAIDLLTEATETDAVLLFVAGRGFDDGPNYRLLPTNAVWPTQYGMGRSRAHRRSCRDALR
jgi:hypothetical protein